MAHVTFFKTAETIGRVRRRKKRIESAVKTFVREQCVIRDGYCRPAKDGFKHECQGPSEWMHLPGYQRWETRGRPPEERHTTKGTAMGCRGIHRRIDGKAFPKVIPQMGPAGANGTIKWASGDAVRGDRP